MAIPDSQDANILEAEALNWRLIVYPLVAALILLLVGFGIYSYLQNQRAEREAAARQAFIQAKTPDALVHVADQFPQTTHALFALLSAADLSFGQKDYDAAAKDYRRVIASSDTDPVLRDAAQIGLASALEADNKTDDAISAYLVTAHRGNKSPYAPYAYASAARLYGQVNDPADEQKILTEAASLGTDSPFVKEAQARLQMLNLNSGAPSPANPSPEPPSPKPPPPPPTPGNS